MESSLLQTVGSISVIRDAGLSGSAPRGIIDSEMGREYQINLVTAKWGAQ
jgi:hypothetical protein